MKCLKELPGLVFKTFCQGDSEGSRIASDNIRKLTGILFPHQTTLLSVLCISIIRSHQLNPTRIFCLCFLVLIRVREDFYRENFNFQYSLLMFLRVQPTQIFNNNDYVSMKLRKHIIHSPFCLTIKKKMHIYIHSLFTDDQRGIKSHSQFLSLLHQIVHLAFSSNKFIAKIEEHQYSSVSFCSCD